MCVLFFKLDADAGEEEGEEEEEEEEEMLPEEVSAIPGSDFFLFIGTCIL